MTPLRQRMIEDMQLKDYSESTHSLCQCCSSVVRTFRQSPRQDYRRGSPRLLSVRQKHQKMEPQHQHCRPVRHQIFLSKYH